MLDDFDDLVGENGTQQWSSVNEQFKNDEQFKHEGDELRNAVGEWFSGACGGL